ncbi:hypothetical protein PV327_011410 [Microctonus hyperodae]|uniref:HAT C-terminal dimerisation domain-containing protein n=1 Tax=Microctonus hyperodae TaxID=165561 RepID=A0AA39ESC6_MICHY|nr:hypothetical protein PV327_011410 [Microctonus hyperodae]
MHLVRIINSEWVNLPYFLEDEQTQHFSSLPLENMLSEIFKLEYTSDLPAFNNLKKLVDLVLILPHSNAEAESVFSNVTDVVTKKRNRIGNDKVAAICKFN